ncbi:hypothetical protein ACQR1Y_02845 [Bradyrhizobium sp. HKCCYLRH3099]
MSYPTPRHIMDSALPQSRRRGLVLRVPAVSAANALPVNIRLIA